MVLAHYFVVGIAPCTDEEADTFAEVADSHANEEKDAGTARMVVEDGTTSGREDIEDVAQHCHDEEFDE